MSRNTRESFLPPLWLLTLLGVVGVLWVLLQLKELVVLLVVGYCISYAIEPILLRLQRRRIGRATGIFVVFGCFVIFVLLCCLTAIPTIVRQYENLSQNLPGYFIRARDQVLPWIEDARMKLPASIAAQLNVASLESLLPDFSGETVGKVVRAVTGALLQGYSITLTLVNLTLLPLIVFYLSASFPEMHRNALQILGPQARKTAATLAREIDGYTSAFVRGQITVCSILFVLYAIGLWAIGVDLWLLLAVISGFGNVIPYFGFLIGIVLSSVMAIVTFGEIWALFAVLGLFGTVQLLEGFVITPRVLENSVGLSPLVIILALFAGGQLFGLLGIFLAVPMAAVLRVVLNHLRDWVLARST
jgi:predicted PurR-regulated permease PerM